MMGWIWPALLLLCAFSAGDVRTLDVFEEVDQWKVHVSDGVDARIAKVEGLEGSALRLDVDFQRGAGFCVVRRELDLALPENYRFRFKIRGEAPNNNLEFKLVDPSGDNVWWVNQRGFSFPKEWTQITYKARKFQFAWGPSGGTRLTRIGAIEFAIAAAEGGQGTIWIDSLEFEPLPFPAPLNNRPRVRASSAMEGKGVPDILTMRMHWRSDPADPAPWIEFDYGQRSEFGGVKVNWAPAGPFRLRNDPVIDYDILVSDDGQDWETAATITKSAGRHDYVPLPDTEGRFIRLAIKAPSPDRPWELRYVKALPAEFSESANAMFKTIAAEEHPCIWPDYFHDRLTPWTVIGADGGGEEALLDAHGALEVGKLAFRIEPIVLEEIRPEGVVIPDPPSYVLCWGSAKVSLGLEQGCLPIPTVTWDVEDWRLETTALVDGDADNATVLARYRMTNLSDKQRIGKLVLAVRPFQVLPPWQELNITGGFSPINDVTMQPHEITVNGERRMFSLTAASEVDSNTMDIFDVAERLPSAAEKMGLNSAFWQYEFDFAPGESKTVVIASPFRGGTSANAPMAETANAAEWFDERLRTVADAWQSRVSKVQLVLPQSAKHLSDTFKTVQAHILINADGPAIQPGSRSYERSWIRDGALTSTALLGTGHFRRAAAFLDWYAPNQFADGKIPCVVDQRGPDPVPEHDSTGQFIYALHKYYKFTQDRSLLERHWDRVVAAVDYIESLRSQRLTDEFREGPPEKRAFYGLVPESISHEGYSAKPMHSYWDDFFILQGLKDAVHIARLLNKPDHETRYTRLRDSFRLSLYESMRLAMQLKNIDYIPGCVELGDFDATSTAIGIFPCGELANMPQPQTANTFDRYYKFFCDRRDGKIEWEAYTPYEVRLIGTFVRLGQPERALALLDYFLANQLPPAWRQWPEVTRRDALSAGFLGDLPHTWVGSDFLSAVRSMFVYERPSDGALVLAAGVDPTWVAEEPGIRVEDFPTEYGSISYTMQEKDGRLAVRLQTQLHHEPASIVIHCPHNRSIRSVLVDGKAHEHFTERAVTLPAANADVEITYAD
jgi:hypothetical protein